MSRIIIKVNGTFVTIWTGRGNLPLGKILNIARDSVDGGEPEEIRTVCDETDRVLCVWAPGEGWEIWM